MKKTTIILICIILCLSFVAGADLISIDEQPIEDQQSNFILKETQDLTIQRQEDTLILNNNIILKEECYDPKNSKEVYEKYPTYEIEEKTYSNTGESIRFIQTIDSDCLHQKVSWNIKPTRISAFHYRDFNQIIKDFKLNDYKTLSDGFNAKLKEDENFFEEITKKWYYICWDNVCWSSRSENLDTGTYYDIELNEKENYLIRKNVGEDKTLFNDIKINDIIYSNRVIEIPEHNVTNCTALIEFMRQTNCSYNNNTQSDLHGFSNVETTWCPIRLLNYSTLICDNSTDWYGGGFNFIKNEHNAYEPAIEYYHHTNITFDDMYLSTQLNRTNLTLNYLFAGIEDNTFNATQYIEDSYLIHIGNKPLSISASHFSNATIIRTTFNNAQPSYVSDDATRYCTTGFCERYRTSYFYMEDVNLFYNDGGMIAPFKFLNGSNNIYIKTDKKTSINNNCITSFLANVENEMSYVRADCSLFAGIFFSTGNFNFTNSDFSQVSTLAQGALATWDLQFYNTMKGFASSDGVTPIHATFTWDSTPYNYANDYSFDGENWEHDFIYYRQTGGTPVTNYNYDIRLNVTNSSYFCPTNKYFYANETNNFAGQDCIKIPYAIKLNPDSDFKLGV